MPGLRLKTLDTSVLVAASSGASLVACCREFPLYVGQLHVGRTCQRLSTPEDCQGANETILGPGVDRKALCEGNPSCVTGCCFPDRKCQDMESSQCENEGGRPQIFLCSKPDLCEGTCCKLAETGLECTEYATRAWCEDIAGGWFLDRGYLCQPDDPCISGCCTGPEGHRTCQSLNRPDCDAIGGTWKTLLCVDRPCMEACCLGGGGCSDYPGFDCLLLGGEPHVGSCADSPCDDNHGCCFPDKACENKPLLECSGLGGVLIYGVAGTLCSESECDGTCCEPILDPISFPDTGFLCHSNVSNAQCDATAGGTFNSGGYLCQPDNPCLSGCCTGPEGDRTCQNSNKADCDANGGLHKDLLCSGGPCVGSCCILIPDFITGPKMECMTVINSLCADWGGDVQPEGCGLNDCEIKGCCRQPDFDTCRNIAVGLCKNNDWEVQDTLCGDGPTDCDPHACCTIPDTPPLFPACKDRSIRECEQHGGTLHRDVLCADDPDVCKGACCFCGYCCDLFESECTWKGVWLEGERCGDGATQTSCSSFQNIPQPRCNVALWRPAIPQDDRAVAPVSVGQLFMMGTAKRSYERRHFIGGMIGTSPDQDDSTAFAYITGQWVHDDASTDPLHVSACRVSQCETVIHEDGFVDFKCDYRCGCAPPECAGV